MLAMFTGACALGCGGGTNGETGIPPAPDYSMYTDTMDFYAYSPPTDGTWKLDGELMSTGEDYRSVARYREYAEAGLTMLLAQSSGQYSGETWEGSIAQMVLDNAYEAGITKVILADTRIFALSRSETGLVGPGLTFSSYDALDAYVESCMAPYTDHPGFYGLQLVDEPTYKQFKAIGEVYKSIRRVRPGTFVQCNLCPLDNNSFADARYPAGDDIYTRFEQYLRDWLRESGADYIMYDSYPFKANGIMDTFIRGLQIAGKVCRDEHVKFYHVAQTCAINRAGQPYLREVNEDDMYWQINMALGHGVKQLAYFTYWTKQDNQTNGEFFIDGASFMTRDGKKTDLYPVMQQIHDEIRKFAPVIMQFDFNASKYVAKRPTSLPASYIASAEDSATFMGVDEVTVDKEVAMVTELKDSVNGRYLYMVQNAINPYYKNGAATKQTVTVTFAERFEYVAVYCKGEVRTERLENGTYSVRLDPGQAEYLMPY